jgi:hypothetical protein
VSVVVASVDSASVGDPATFLTLAALHARLDALPPAPRDAGSVRMLIARGQRGVEEGEVAVGDAVAVVSRAPSAG